MADIVVTQSSLPTPVGQLSKNNRRGRKRKTRLQRFKEKLPQPSYGPIVKESESLVRYYKQQSIFNQDEFEDFMRGLRETLPASFRINTFDLTQARFLRQLVQGPQFDEFLSKPGTNINDVSETGYVQEESIGSDGKQAVKQEKPPVLDPLCWYPRRFGWQMNITRLDLKKSPILQQLHKFLMAETDNGFISRQEAVSMIPPLLLDVKIGQNLLDMCAAPGSKTAQLLEYLKCDLMATKPIDPVNSSATDNLFDDGMVVANDVDNKRCYMLVHQSNRLNSPNCIIINQDAARLPDMKSFNNDGDEYSNLKFDRILCDVPCSGDGTLRKNPDVWKKWSVANANNFHGMQCKILKRGIELLKENGLLVYSTCSMNPVEDEAVIASILRLSKGSVVLEDVAHKLPGLKYCPGTSKWVIMNKELNVIPSVNEVPAENVSQIYPSLFPPTELESKEFNLHKCMRILPHLQNTGGFFVAVLRKSTAELPWESSATKELNKANPAAVIKQLAPNPKKRRFSGFKEDPFHFLDAQDPDWISIRDVYGLKKEFPFNQLVHRCSSGKKRSIYLVSRRVRSFIIANREEPNRQDFVKIINGGMRLFSRAQTEAGFRICQDGVGEILPYIKDEIKVPLCKDDLVALLRARSVQFDSLSSAQHIKDNIKQGSFILIYRHQQQPDELDDQLATTEMPLVAWKGERTVALYVSKTYRVHLCALAELKIGDDISCDVIKQNVDDEIKDIEEQ